jgi:opacity protein-like surface antigen
MIESNTQYRLSDAHGGAVHRFAKMKYAAAGSALSVIAALTLQSAPAVAQEHAGTQSVEIFGGEQFGDNVTDVPVSGRTPHLNDSALAGARYNYNFTDMWGIQLSSGYSWSRAARVASGKDDLGLTTVDLDAVWNITPQYPVVAYAIIGAGYAWANLDTPISGEIDGRPVALTDGNGFTANAGIGAKYYLVNSLYVDFQARYRYLSRLVSDSNQHLNTSETTLGFGWRFSPK